MTRRAITVRAALAAAVVMAGFRVAAATTDTYGGADGGLWSVAGNWSAGIPNNAGAQTYGVVINVPAVTVQLDMAATIDTLSLGGTDTLHILPGNSLTLAAGSMVNGGTLWLDNGTSAQLLLKSDTQILGEGAIVLAGASNHIDSLTAARLISNNAISGEGAIGSGTLLKVVNMGSITATTGMLTLNASANTSVTDSFINFGTFAADGGTLALSGGYFDNSGGIIEARANSVLTISPGTTVNGGVLRTQGGTITLGGSPAVSTLANTAFSGLVQNVKGSVALVGSLSNAGTLSIQGGSLFLGGPNTFVPVILSNTGVIQVGSTSMICPVGDTTITGGGTIVLDGNAYQNPLSGPAPPLRLTTSNVILGRGTLGGLNYGSSWSNSGTIAATTGVLTLACNSYYNSFNPINHYNTGTLRADGGTLAISGVSTSHGVIDNTSGVIEAFPNSVVSVTNTGIVGGTIRTVGGGTVTASNAAFVDVALQGTIQSSTSLGVQGTSTNTGTLTSSAIVFGSSAPGQAVTLVNKGLVQVAGGNLGWISLSADTTLTGGGSVTLDARGTPSMNSGGGYRLTTDNFISGDGIIGRSDSYCSYLTNSGTITASTGTLTVYGGYVYNSAALNQNTGLLRADGGRLVLASSGGGGAILNNANGVIEAAANSVVAISLGVSGGTVRALGGGTVTMGGAMTDVAMDGMIQAGSNISFYGDLTNAGSLVLSGNTYFGPGSPTPNTPPVTLDNSGLIQVVSGVSLYFGASTTFSGSGSITLNGNAFMKSGSNNVRLINNTFILGKGTLGSSGNAGTFLTNNGTITASTGVLTVDTGSGNSNAPQNDYNSGLLRADGGTLNVTGNLGVINTGGVVEAAANSVVLWIGSGVTGGTVRSVGGGTISLRGCSLYNTALGGVFQIPAGATAVLAGNQSIAGSLSITGGNSGMSTLFLGANTGLPSFTSMANSGVIQADWHILMELSSDVLLFGGGSLTLNGSTISGNLGYCLTTDNFISGWGALGDNMIRLINNGTISATIGALTVQTTRTTANHCLNTGTMRADGGTLVLSGGTVTNTGGVVEAIHNSRVSLKAVVNGGTLRAASGGILGLDAAGVIGPDVTIAMEGGVLQYGSANATDYSGQFSKAANQAFNIDTNWRTVFFATAFTSAGSSLTKLGAGTLCILGYCEYGPVTVSGGELVPGGTFKVQAITVATAADNSYTATLRLSDNKLIVQTTDAADKAAKAWSLEAALAAGLQPAGKGISTLMAAGYAPAVYDNADLGFSSFGLLAVDTSSLLVTPALIGDTNNDGAVDGTDLENWYQHRMMHSPLTNWGDFNRDGWIDGLDFDLWFAGAGPGAQGLLDSRGWDGAALSGLRANPVPEPGTVGVGVGVVGLLMLRRKWKVENRK